MAPPATAFEKYMHKVGAFEHTASLAFGRVGYTCALHPCKTILASLLVGVAFLCGFMAIELASEGVWVDPNSEPQLNNDWVGSVYPPWANKAKILVAAKDGGSVFRKDIWAEVFQLKAEVEALTVEVDGETKAFADLCLRTPLGDCAVTGALSFFENDPENFANVSSDADVLAAVAATTWPKVGGHIDHKMVFAALTLDADGAPASATALRMSWLTHGPGRGEWEDEFVKLFCGEQFQSVTKSFEHLQVQMRVGKSGTDELDRNVSGDISLFASCFLVMIIVATFVLGKPCSAIKGRSALAGADVGLILMSIGAGYGFSFICGIPFSLLAQILPFILIGIGIDDGFVIASAMDVADHSKSVEERMRDALERVGMSITMTSLTDVAAFGLGCMSKLPAIKYFCFMGMAAIVFIYGFHLTWFVAMLSLDTRRQEASRVDCLCCLKLNRVQVLEEVSDTSPGSSSASKKVKPPSFFRRIMRAYAELLVRNMVTKALVITFFLVIFAVALWAMIAKTQTGFDLMDITPDKSYLRNMYLAEEEYFGIRGQDDNIPAIMYFGAGEHMGKTDFSSPAVQAEMFAAADEVLDLETIQTDKRVKSWFVDWHDYATVMAGVPGSLESTLSLERACSNGQVPSCKNYFKGANFFAAVADWVATPYRVLELNGTQSVLVGGQRFKDDIIFSEGKTSILTSRMYAYHVDMSTSKDQIKALNEVEEFYHSKQDVLSGFMICNDLYPLYDQYRIIVRELLTTFAMCLVAVLVISVVVLVHPINMLLVTLVLLMIFVDLFGAVSMWGLEVNSLTGICLICAIGLVVDYTAHIAHSFSLQNPFETRDRRVIEALTEMGPPVAMGVLTTMVAIVPLGFANSESFRVFFRMFMSMVVVGGLHGLVLVPAILSIVGPALPFRKFLASESNVVDISVRSSGEDTEQGKPKEAWAGN